MTTLETAIQTATTDEPQETARELLILTGTILAESLRSITLDAEVGTQLGGGDEPENYQTWSAEKVRPHLRRIINGVANTEQILDAVDGIRFSWEDRFADFPVDQLVTLIGDRGRINAEKVFERYGIDGGWTFLCYRGLTVNSGGRTAHVRPMEPYLGAAKAYWDAMGTYADVGEEDRYERAIAILKTSVEWAAAAQMRDGR